MRTFSRRTDLSDVFLIALAVALAAGFGYYAMPSLLSIYQGTYRAMPLPDGTELNFSTEIQGMVALARRGRDVEVSGWAYDRRNPERNIKIEIYVGGRRVAAGVTDLEEEDVSREAGVKLATPRFVLRFPADLSPADPNEPIHVFAIGEGQLGREIFKGGRAVHVVDETQPKPAK